MILLIACKVYNTRVQTSRSLCKYSLRSERWYPSKARTGRRTCMGRYHIVYSNHCSGRLGEQHKFLTQAYATSFTIY
jgi:hypothetical protein